MKRFLSVLMICTFVFTMALPVMAVETEPTDQTEESFDLIEYLEDHTVRTQSDFFDVIEYYGNDEAADSIVGCKAEWEKHKSEYSAESFTYQVDVENQLVYTTTVHSKDTNSSARYVGKQKSVAVSKTVYSSSGIRLFYVEGHATFNYLSGVSSEAVSGEGYFNPAVLSAWTGSVAVDKGNYSATKAFVKVYGTANLNLGVAEILGLQLNIQSVNFVLTITCDSDGNVEDFYSQSTT